MTDGLPNPQRLLAFITIAIAIMMAVLDTSIINLALPVISDALHISPARSVWVVNAYQLAITVLLLPLAALSDRLGYKRIYWWGLAIFTAASLACASAGSLEMLAVARVVQGIGAAGIMSVNIALVRFIFPKASLGVGVGYASLVVAVSSAAGPAVASLILAMAQWPTLFLVNVPLGLVALLVGAKTLPHTPASSSVRLDLLSVLLNGLTFGGLIAGLMWISEPARREMGVWVLLAALLIALCYVRRETLLAQPLLPIDLLRMPVFSLSMLTSICSFAAQTMALLAVPFYCMKQLGISSTTTGLLLTAWPLATALIAPSAGRWSDRITPQYISSIGLLVLGGGLFALCQLQSAPGYVDIAWRLALCGMGFGLFQSPNNRVIMGSAPKERSGSASGLQAMGRLLGQSSGAVLVALLFAGGNAGEGKGVLAVAAGLALFAAAASGLRKQPVAMVVGG